MNKEFLHLQNWYFRYDTWTLDKSISICGILYISKPGVVCIGNTSYFIVQITYSICCSSLCHQRYSVLLTLVVETTWLTCHSRSHDICRLYCYRTEVEWQIYPHSLIPQSWLRVDGSPLKVLLRLGFFMNWDISWDLCAIDLKSIIRNDLNSVPDLQLRKQQQ